MNKKKSVAFVLIASCCFLLLCAVQFYLLYNTYKLKSQSYYNAEKEAIKEEYGRLIKDDKLFPGGDNIIKQVLQKHVQLLTDLHNNYNALSQSYKRLIVNDVVSALRQQECLSTFFNDHSQKLQIADSIVYALVINSLEIDINNNEPFTLYNKTEEFQYSSLNGEDGLRIGGTLKHPDKSDLVVSITVNPEQPNSYHISFALYVDSNKHFISILKQMIPAFCLSAGSILIIFILFFTTFRKWQSQKKLSEMKTDFINNITHEFNTPLAAIIVANKGLKNEKFLQDKNIINNVSDVIGRQANRLQQLVNQVLDVVSFNKFTVHCTETSLHDAINEIIMDFRARADSNKIQIRLQPGSANDNILIDQFYFTTLLINILDNAIKYNDSVIKWINISTKDDGYNVVLTISDNGLGMDAETQKNAFAKFYRNTENSSSHMRKGIGLGLYYAKKIAKAHGWHIKIQSELGEGAMFVIVIPKPVH